MKSRKHGASFDTFHLVKSKNSLFILLDYEGVVLARNRVTSDAEVDITTYTAGPGIPQSCTLFPILCCRQP